MRIHTKIHLSTQLPRSPYELGQANGMTIGQAPQLIMLPDGTVAMNPGVAPQHMPQASPGAHMIPMLGPNGQTVMVPQMQPPHQYMGQPQQFNMMGPGQPGPTSAMASPRLPSWQHQQTTFHGMVPFGGIGPVNPGQSAPGPLSAPIGAATTSGMPPIGMPGSSPYGTTVGGPQQPPQPGNQGGRPAAPTAPSGPPPSKGGKGGAASRPGHGPAKGGGAAAKGSGKGKGGATPTPSRQDPPSRGGASSKGNNSRGAGTPTKVTATYASHQPVRANHSAAPVKVAPVMAAPIAGKVSTVAAAPAAGSAAPTAKVVAAAEETDVSTGAEAASVGDWVWDDAKGHYVRSSAGAQSASSMDSSPNEGHASVAGAGRSAKGPGGPKGAAAGPSGKGPAAVSSQDYGAANGNVRWDQNQPETRDYVVSSNGASSPDWATHASAESDWGQWATTMGAAETTGESWNYTDGGDVGTAGDHTQDGGAEVAHQEENWDENDWSAWYPESAGDAWDEWTAGQNQEGHVAAEEAATHGAEWHEGATAAAAAGEWNEGDWPESGDWNEEHHTATGADHAVVEAGAAEESGDAGEDWSEWKEPQGAWEGEL